MSRALIAALCLVASSAFAAPSGRFVPFCIATNVSPVPDGIHVYVNGTLYRSANWCMGAGFQCSAYVVGQPSDMISVRTYKGMTEGPALASAQAVTGPNCATSGPPGATSVRFDTWPDAAADMAGLAMSCLSKPACAALLLKTCTGDATCKGTLAPLIQTDVNENGVIDAGDTVLWNDMLNGHPF